MNGEKKFVLVMLGVGMLCLTILYTFLFLSLWPYKEWVAASLLVLLALWIGVSLRGKLVEQQMRQMRYRPYEEVPLDGRGEPVYWPQGAQPNPHRAPQSSEQSYAYRPQYQERS